MSATPPKSSKSAIAAALLASAFVGWHFFLNVYFLFLSPPGFGEPAHYAYWLDTFGRVPVPIQVAASPFFLPILTVLWLFLVGLGLIRHAHRQVWVLNGLALLCLLATNWVLWIPLQGQRFLSFLPDFITVMRRL